MDKDSENVDNRRIGIIFVGGIILFVCLALAISILFIPENQNPGKVIGEVVLKQEQDLTEITDTGGTRFPSASERLEERYTLNRENYNIYLDKQGKDTFGNLPTAPKDFGSITYLISTGKKKDFESVEKAYFLQPEFFPLFEENGLPFYEEYDPRYIGTYGWGIYPSEQWLNSTPGTTGNLFFYFKTGWGIETWQGMNLKLESNCEGVTAEIENPLFITPPTYPEFCVKEICGEDWVRLMKVKISIEEGVPEQSCLLSLRPISIPKEKNKEWFDKYLTDYVAGTSSLVTAGVPLQIHLEVSEMA